MTPKPPRKLIPEWRLPAFPSLLGCSQSSALSAASSKGRPLNTDPNRACTGSNHSQAGTPAFPPRHLLGRLCLLAGILAFDCVVVAYVPHPAPLIGALAPFGIFASAVFFGLGYSKLKVDRDDLPFGTWLFIAHLVCIAAVYLAVTASGNNAVFLLLARILLLLGVSLAALSCVPFRKWIFTIRRTSPLWAYALFAGLLAWLLRNPFQSLWNVSSSSTGRTLQAITFHSVQMLLQPFLPGLMVDPARFIMGTDNFAVTIAEQCSGLEGLGLVLVFTTVWLWYFRKQNRFPHALLLVPCALVSVWVLNIVRIAGLILIGNAGAEEVAMVGFHSQAGWIAFTAVALVFSMATRKLAWVRKVPAAGAVVLSAVEANQSSLSRPEEEAGESPATSAFLVPFLAILAASFVSRAASGYFEWLYPLRFLAAAVAIWYFRAEYKKLDWRFSWTAPLAGLAVFLIWIAPTFWFPHPEVTPLASALAALSPTARYAWIAFRIVAAIVTVPIAEELVFRGYLTRRILSRDFESVPFRNITFLSIAISSIAFGLMHGQQWIVGIIAGLLYALVVKSSSRIGDAVAAHATTNLLLAAWVLTRGDWFLW